jgi:hypothetical protein
LVDFTGRMVRGNVGGVVNVGIFNPSQETIQTKTIRKTICCLDEDYIIKLGCQSCRHLRDTCTSRFVCLPAPGDAQ